MEKKNLGRFQRTKQDTYMILYKRNQLLTIRDLS